MLASLSVAFVMIGAACTVFNGKSVPESPDGSTTPGDGGATLDGSNTTTDGNAIDSGGPSGRFCDRDASFCADFDTSDAATAGWSVALNTDNVSTIEVDPVTYHSPPHALRIRMPPGAPNCAEASLRQTFGGSFATSRLEIALRPTGAPFGKTYFLGQVLNSTSASCEIGIGSASDANAFVSESDSFSGGGGDYRETSLGVPFPTDQWRSIVLSVDRRASPVAFSVTVDNGAAVTGTLRAECSAAITSVDLTLGFGCENNGTPHEARYDDVWWNITR